MADGAPSPSDADLGAGLLRVADDYTRTMAALYSYVESRPVAVQPYLNAFVSGQKHVTAGEYVGAVYDGEGRLVPSSQRFNKGDLQPIDPPTVEPDRVAAARHLPRAVYGGMIFMVLGHFLFETAARLWPQVDLGARPTAEADRLRFIFHPCWGFSMRHFMEAPFFERSLTALGVKPEAVLLAEEDLRVDLLYYAEPISIYHEYVHPMMNRVLDHLQAELARPRTALLGLGRRKGGGAQRIFLSRSRWNLHVRVANEAELEDVFRERGFTVVHPQLLEPDEMIRIMGEADILASTDGSHAHLATFCRPGTRTILLDTRPVPTQTAIEALRRLRGVHLPVFEPSCEVWDEPNKRMDPVRVRAFVDAALRAE